MKKIALLMACLMLFGSLVPAVSAATKDAGAATILSACMPGTGEWYNGDFQGSFPFVECIVGSLCFLVQFSSAFDAANGVADAGMRFDFWSAPGK